jgi:Kelch motif
MPGTTPLPCSHSAMVYNGTKILLLDTGNYPGQSNYLNETATWSGDGSTGNWTVVSTSQVDPLGPLPCRTYQGMALDGSSTEVVLFGGEGSSETVGVLDDTWTWTTGGVWAKSPTAVVPFGRYRHSMALLNGVGSFMFGGSNVLNFLSESWLYSGGVGGNWQLLTPGTVPPARVDFAMAGKTSATNILMYGGKGTNSNFGDTWMWVGSSTGNWIKQTPAVSPPFMSEMCMGYDVTNNQYVMFGGRMDDNLLAPPQTWIWSGDNGGNWNLATPANSPASRVGAMMAWNGTHLIMFGGYGNGSRASSQTWQWTGGIHTGNWVQL